MNFFRCVGVLLALTTSTAACSTGVDETGAASDQAALSKEERKECPVYAAPLCGPGETLRTVKGADGCDAPQCGQCPVYAAPLCGPGETLRTVKGANGCDVPECQASK